MQLWFTPVPQFCSCDPLSHAFSLRAFPLLVLNSPLLLQCPAKPGYFKSLDVLYFHQVKLLSTKTVEQKSPQVSTSY